MGKNTQKDEDGAAKKSSKTDPKRLRALAQRRLQKERNRAAAERDKYNDRPPEKRLTKDGKKLVTRRRDRSDYMNAKWERRDAKRARRKERKKEKAALKRQRQREEWALEGQQQQQQGQGQGQGQERNEENEEKVNDEPSSADSSASSSSADSPSRAPSSSTSPSRNETLPQPEQHEKNSISVDAQGMENNSRSSLRPERKSSVAAARTTGSSSPPMMKDTPHKQRRSGLMPEGQRVQETVAAAVAAAPHLEMLDRYLEDTQGGTRLDLNRIDELLESLSTTNSPTQPKATLHKQTPSFSSSSSYSSSSPQQQQQQKQQQRGQRKQEGTVSVSPALSVSPPPPPPMPPSSSSFTPAMENAGGSGGIGKDFPRSALPLPPTASLSHTHSHSHAHTQQQQSLPPPPPLPTRPQPLPTPSVLGARRDAPVAKVAPPPPPPSAEGSHSSQPHSAASAASASSFSSSSLLQPLPKPPISSLPSSAPVSASAPPTHTSASVQPTTLSEEDTARIMRERFASLHSLSETLQSERPTRVNNNTTSDTNVYSLPPPLAVTGDLPQGKSLTPNRMHRQVNKSGDNHNGEEEKEEEGNERVKENRIRKEDATALDSVSVGHVYAEAVALVEEAVRASGGDGGGADAAAAERDLENGPIHKHHQHRGDGSVSNSNSNEDEGSNDQRNYSDSDDENAAEGPSGEEEDEEEEEEEGPGSSGFVTPPPPLSLLESHATQPQLGANTIGSISADSSSSKEHPKLSAAQRWYSFVQTSQRSSSPKKKPHIASPSVAAAECAAAPPAEPLSAEFRRSVEEFFHGRAFTQTEARHTTKGGGDRGTPQPVASGASVRASLNNPELLDPAFAQVAATLGDGSREAPTLHSNSVTSTGGVTTEQTESHGHACVSGRNRNDCYYSNYLTLHSSTAALVEAVVGPLAPLPRQAIYDRSNCPMGAAEGFTPEFHAAAQRYLTSRALNPLQKPTSSSSSSLSSASLSANASHHRPLMPFFTGKGRTLSEAAAAASGSGNSLRSGDGVGVGNRRRARDDGSNETNPRGADDDAGETPEEMWENSDVDYVLLAKQQAAAAAASSLKRRRLEGNASREEAADAASGDVQLTGSSQRVAEELTELIEEKRKILLAHFSDNVSPAPSAASNGDDEKEEEEVVDASQLPKPSQQQQEEVERGTAGEQIERAASGRRGSPVPGNATTTTTTTAHDEAISGDTLHMNSTKKVNLSLRERRLREKLESRRALSRAWADRVIPAISARRAEAAAAAARALETASAGAARWLAAFEAIQEEAKKETPPFHDGHAAGILRHDGSGGEEYHNEAERGRRGGRRGARGGSRSERSPSRKKEKMSNKKLRQEQCREILHKFVSGQ